ncbi:MAG: hypothetical protein NMK33_03775 [Candidatus Cardinium sp.]|uniref:hypothetical protein n=1 Tax=Cardinium endosymbiont of Dermatophagoides farinae TaxID=2597823 RepID=UPI001CB95B55|nr:hypothetical protein [Cardinium endosymbiont of Dermatophagoides farinae]UWW96551.1 MAG: hypothetical protein NMK33_03775 [Candidatus Cardinium sp.]
MTEDKYPELEKIIREHIPKEDKEDIMRTIAQKYRDEGIQIGQEKGKLEGEKEKAITIARSMLEKRYPLEDIILLTGLSRSQIHELM